MYAPGTILAAREPQSTDDYTYPYDRVIVIGQSPVQHATASGSVWAGADATGFIVRPLEGFDSTVDKPLGELQQMYDIEEYPTDAATGQPITPENNPANRPSPEQLLRAAAEKAPKPATRPKTPSVQADDKTPEQVLREANQTKRGRA